MMRKRRTFRQISYVVDVLVFDRPPYSLSAFCFLSCFSLKTNIKFLRFEVWMDKLSGLVRRRQSARETSQQPSQDVLSPVFPHIRQFEPSLGESVTLPRIYLSGKAAAEPSGDPAAHYFMQQVETSSSTATDQQQSLVVGIRFVLTVGSNMKPPIEHLLDCRWSAGSLVLTAPWGTLRIRLIPVVLDMPPTSCDTLRHRPAPTESAADVAQRWSATIELHERKALLDLEKCRASSTSEAEDNKVLLLILPIYFVTVELVDNAAGRLRDALPWTQLALTMFSPAINATAPASPIPTYWLVWDALRNMLAEH